MKTMRGLVARGASAMGAKGINRRQDPRYKPAFFINVHREEPAAILRDLRVIDVSRGGCAFATSQKLAPGEVLVFDCGEQGIVRARVLSCVRLVSGLCRVCCQAVEGRFPASEPARSA